MSSRFAALAAEAAVANPMSHGDTPLVEGRVLYADGDGLAYYCAGNEETSPGEARRNLLDKLASAKAASGAERVVILLTGAGSHKGYRHSVARIKGYQDQREGKSRPKNWQYLREFLESGGPLAKIEITRDAEADDLFARYAGDNTVIYTQDKDMRMCPGWHLDWLTHIMVHVPAGTWHKPSSDLAKPYGRVFFWQQMLQGDSADNIPGLPFYTDGSVVQTGPNRGKIKEIRIGEPKKDQIGTADKLLVTVRSDAGACLVLKGLYESCYGRRWLVEMLEQGVLLWMRNDPKAHWLNVAEPGNPFNYLTSHEDWPAACVEIGERVEEFQRHEKAQDYGSSEHTGSDAGEAAAEMCNLPVTVLDNPSSSGSRSLNGTCASDLAPWVQQPAGQGGEQLQTVRSSEPCGFPTWARRLLATPCN